MPESIRAARIIETYYTRSYTASTDPGGNAPSARDSVRISPEALEKFRKLKEDQVGQQPQKPPASTQSTLEDTLNLLDLGTTADPAQVRKAYLSAVNKYHPDKFAGLPPEFQKLAEEKTKQITTAYARLKSCMANP